MATPTNLAPTRPLLWLTQEIVTIYVSILAQPLNALTTPLNVVSAFPGLPSLPRYLKIGPSKVPAPSPLAELDDPALIYHVAWGISLNSPSFR